MARHFLYFYIHFFSKQVCGRDGGYKEKVATL
ncbi:MAG: hypothetical protein ACI8RD_009156, partial [Bacillariaceae sp.]